MDLDKLSWKSMKFEEIGFNANFEGLIGIEECTDYGVVSKKKRRRGGKKEKKHEKKQLKRKASDSEEEESVTVSPKKTKNTSFGSFFVEDVDSKTLISPSKTSSQANNTEKKKNSKNDEKGETIKTKEAKKRKKKQKTKKTKGKETKSNGAENRDEKKADKMEVEETDKVEIDVPLDNMQAWTRFNLPESILKGLAVQHFTNPTMIQELTLPAAIFGRRDILGAAETGSGKTLAFGLPIINAILQLKQKPFMGLKDKFRKTKKVKKEDSNKNNEQAKIINYNKLTPDERGKLLEEHKGVEKNKKKRSRKAYEDENDGSDVSEDENVDDDSSEEDDSEIEEDNSEADEENSDMDEINSDMEEGNSDADESISEIDDKNSDVDEEDSGLDDGDYVSKGNKGDKKQNGKLDGSKKSDSGVEFENNKSGDESDFEEMEEDVDGINEKGIGCVKVIDNVVSDDLPALNESRKVLKPLYALILTPTRELAIQVKCHLTAAAKFTDISVAVIVGGMSQEKQERLLSRGPEIVVATPGRLWQLIQQGNPHLSKISDIRFLAIDETDRMLEHGHFEELHQLLERLNEDEDKRGGRQNFVFSATLTMVHDLPKHLKKKRVTKKGKIINKKIEKLTADQKLKKVIGMLGITDPKIVDVTKQNQGASTTLVECRITCPIEQKDYYLFYVLKRHPGRTIIFCNSIGCVKRLSQLFSLLQCNPLPLHANMQQRQRLKNLDRFRADPLGVLVATDVAARGLDIPDVENVIHYQVPRTAENYVHRSGRTARASKEGITILIMEAGEIQNYNKMCKTLDKKEDLPHFPVDGPLLSAVMQRVDTARELDLLMLKVRKENSQKGWLEKAAKEMDMLLDERNMPKQLEEETSTNMKHILTIKRKQLNSLLATPLFPKGFSFKYPTSNAHLEEALGLKEGQNAIEAMKSALETGAVRKAKNRTKNEALLKLEKNVAAVNKSTNQVLDKKNSVASTENGEKLSKNKWKKMRRNKD